VLGDIRANLAGAWEVMFGRTQGLGRLDTSLEGFWRSFAAVILVVPFAIVGHMSQRLMAEAGGQAAPPLTGPGVALETFALLVDWVAFPLIFALLARPFGLGARYVPFIVARNWASVIIAALVSVIHVLHILGVLSSALAPFFLIVAIAVALRFSYVITRMTLLVSMGMALPIVALDFLVSLTIWSAFDRLATS
jgi:hypothetical protein